MSRIPTAASVTPTHRWAHRLRLLAPLALLTTLALPAHADPAAKTEPAAKTADAGPNNDACLGCHANMASTHVTFEDGASMSIGVDKTEWTASVHNGKLACSDCHSDITGYPHPEIKAASKRDFQLKLSQSCQTCHYDNYTRTLDGIHYKLLEAGNTAAPTCVDCHGSHGITSYKNDKLAIQQRCASCHADIADTYANSVHGKALAQGNTDVPVCTDCHGAHDIRNPEDPTFHAQSYTVCADCHSDAQRMKKYDLNPNVVDTYLDDFHGRSNTLLSEAGEVPDKPLATCTDCHGIHDIQSFDNEGETDAVEARVAQLCRDCHGDVDDSFSKAWLSHYEPTIKTAPLVWGVQWMYRLMIPFIILGLLVHISLHLYRLKKNR